MNNLLLTIGIATFALGLLGYFIRHRAPRTAMFLISLMLFCIGLWLLVSTYQFYIQDEAHLFSRHFGTFKKVDDPEKFVLSVVFHSLLGVFLALFGVYGMSKSITLSNVKFFK